jgi:hypothetical protein
MHMLHESQATHKAYRAGYPTNTRPSMCIQCLEQNMATKQHTWEASNWYCFTLCPIDRTFFTWFALRAPRCQATCRRLWYFTTDGVPRLALLPRERRVAGSISRPLVCTEQIPMTAIEGRCNGYAACTRNSCAHEKEEWLAERRKRK